MASARHKVSVAFRFSAGTVERLKRRAAETRSAQTELAERYIEEGLRQDEHPLISFREGPAGRRPVLLGSRLAVADVVQTIRQNNNSANEAAEYLEIPIEHVEAALRYYVDFKGEVDEWIARTETIAERERQRFEGQRAALQ